MPPLPLLSPPCSQSTGWALFKANHPTEFPLPEPPKPFESVIHRRPLLPTPMESSERSHIDFPDVGCQKAMRNLNNIQDKQLENLKQLEHLQKMKDDLQKQAEMLKEMSEGPFPGMQKFEENMKHGQALLATPEFRNVPSLLGKLLLSNSFLFSHNMKHGQALLATPEFRNVPSLLGKLLLSDSFLSSHSRSHEKRERDRIERKCSETIKL